VSHITGEAKLSLLSCHQCFLRPYASGVRCAPTLIGKDFLQFQECDYSILSDASKQLSALPTAKSLYIKAKSHLLNEVKSTCKDHLQTLSEFGDSAELEASCRNCNRLLSSLHPGQLSFLLLAASDTLPTTMNLRRWNIQCSAKCILCDSPCPTTVPVQLLCLRTDQHDLVLQFLVKSIVGFFVGLPFVYVYADLPNFRASESPPSTIPIDLTVTPY